jgi:hypothetical protein
LFRNKGNPRFFYFLNFQKARNRVYQTKSMNGATWVVPLYCREIVIIASHPKQIMSQKALYSSKGFKERL